jgi:glyoxylase-like metal-dependent hydrolase (beta-lactamase superfamily II)
MYTQPIAVLLAACLMLAIGDAQAVVTGVLPGRWHEGAADCAQASPPPLEVHEYEPQTYILRQSLCADFEAPFLYLLVGAERALLVDTGAVAEPARMPLAETVLRLLPEVNGTRLPLLVVHTHGHSDHRAGDGQFAQLPGVTVVAPGYEHMRSGFDLGGRVVHVIPTPGHEPDHVVFYDERTALLLTGDFLLPGRLLIDDAAAYQTSASRVVDFLADRPLQYALGAHLEMDEDGELFAHGSEHHPGERSMTMSRADVSALPGAFEDFNGFYAAHPAFVLTNPMRNLLALGTVALIAMGLLVWGVRRLIKKRAAGRLT